MNFGRNSVVCVLVASVCFAGAFCSGYDYGDEGICPTAFQKKTWPSSEWNDYQEMSSGQQLDPILQQPQRPTKETRYHTKRGTTQTMEFQRHLPCGTMFHNTKKNDNAAKPWPWVVMIRGNDTLCAGVLITSIWVLTAAHCISSPTHIVLGGDRHHHWPLHSQYRHAVKEIKHPRFIRSTMQNDIALIKMDLPVRFNRHIKPACLPISRNVFRSGEPCFLIGWGNVNEIAPGFPRSLRVVKTSIMSQFECSLRWALGYLILLLGQLCTPTNANNNQGSGFCYADSGSLISCKMDGVYYVPGLASFVSHGCKKSFYPDVFTRVSYYDFWITETIQFNS